MKTQTNASRPTFAGRVIIRPPELADGAEFVRAVRRSGKLHGQWIAPKARTAKKFATYLERYSSGHHYGFLIIDRVSGDIAGVININDVIRGSFQSAAVGYYAFVPYAGKGLMFEGMLLVVKHAFGQLKLHRLEANIQPQNHASIALARKCGFVKEGCGRRLLKIRGRWKDHERWALLREDFRDGTKRNRLSKDLREIIK
jgi:[ribosomal protein S5]-alanine N-acetyltransferase